MLSAKPKLIHGLLFGIILAITHAASGILLVIVVKFILQSSMTAFLEVVTRTTQIISFSLIALFGFYLFIKALIGAQYTNVPDSKPTPAKPVENIFSAVTVGLIPCPGVVMVVLFCVSMDTFWLGIVMGGMVGAGMALTISLVVTIAILGKSAILTGTAFHTGFTHRLEIFIEAMAGIIMAGLGILFLMAIV